MESSSAQPAFGAFAAKALQRAALLARAPASRQVLPGCWQVRLMDGTAAWSLVWPEPLKGVGLAGAAAASPLVWHAGDETQDFENAAEFLLALYTGDVPVPGWRQWALAAWGRHAGPPAPGRAMAPAGLEEAVVAPLRRAYPHAALVAQVAAVLLEHEALAQLLACLAPMAALEDGDAVLALLKDPDAACTALWHGVPPQQRALLPWALGPWMRGMPCSLEQALAQMGVRGDFSMALARMHPAYLHGLAEPLLGFAEPGLARCFWQVATAQVREECRQQALRPYLPVLRSAVPMALVLSAWDAWAQQEPARAALHASRRPRPPV